MYYLDQNPLKTIGMTLRKYQYLKEPELEQKMSLRYHVYRVREDPKTKYRYVTEILNEDEGKQLINKQLCYILIAHRRMVRNPQEDFKNILDEAERIRLREKDLKIEHRRSSSEGNQARNEPSTQSSAPSRVSMSSSNCSDNDLPV